MEPSTSRFFTLFVKHCMFSSTHIDFITFFIDKRSRKTNPCSLAALLGDEKANIHEIEYNKQISEL